eukprot:49792_1
MGQSESQTQRLLSDQEDVKYESISQQHEKNRTPKKKKGLPAFKKKKRIEKAWLSFDVTLGEINVNEEYFSRDGYLAAFWIDPHFEKHKNKWKLQNDQELSDICDEEKDEKQKRMMKMMMKIHDCDVEEPYRD